MIHLPPLTLIEAACRALEVLVPVSFADDEDSKIQARAQACALGIIHDGLLAHEADLKRRNEEAAVDAGARNSNRSGGT